MTDVTERVYMEILFGNVRKCKKQHSLIQPNERTESFLHKQTQKLMIDTGTVIHPTWEVKGLVLEGAALNLD